MDEIVDSRPAGYYSNNFGIEKVIVLDGDDRGKQFEKKDFGWKLVKIWTERDVALLKCYLRMEAEKAKKIIAAKRKSKRRSMRFSVGGDMQIRRINNRVKLLRG